MARANTQNLLRTETAGWLAKSGDMAGWLAATIFEFPVGKPEAASARRNGAMLLFNRVTCS